MSAAFDIATRMQQLALGTVGTDIGVNAFMDKGDNEYAVFEFPGEPEVVTMGGVTQIEYLNVQIQVRNKSNDQAQTRCYQAYTLLRGTKGIQLNGVDYDYIESKMLPAKLNVDEQLRTTWYCELKLHRKP